MIPIDIQVSRSRSKVKPIIHMLEKGGGISVLQTIFYEKIHPGRVTLNRTILVEQRHYVFAWNPFVFSRCIRDKYMYFDVD